MAAIRVAGLGKGEYLFRKEGVDTAISVQASASCTGGKPLPSPTDLVGAALGTCMLAVMESMLERSGYDTAAFSLDIEKEMADSPRRIAGFSVKIRPPCMLDVSLQRKLERAAGLCPVTRSLGPDVKIHVIWEQPDGRAKNESDPVEGLQL
ncbi:OsmC family protein [Desulfobotulus sp. H1]|uniref:OsmC family protein n=1 Tax=Desulfobotulus pelophilus TaxID=2823377 RepID=A0ABT3NBT7_9BACT|nr:OsmC family protein [Desulfobotulus pelophilus]MCW7754934.1 OsmC family protein [Desulfobotulus pelophilus]